MIDICLPTSLKSACCASATHVIAVRARTEAAFRNQDIVMKNQSGRDWKRFRRDATFFGKVDF
jgi:hypothetical protein